MTTSYSHNTATVSNTKSHEAQTIKAFTSTKKGVGSSPTLNNGFDAGQDC